MSRVFSTRLYGGVPGAGPAFVAWVVPSGYRTVVKYFTIIQASAAGNYVDLSILPLGVSVARLQVPSGQSIATLSCTITLHEGESGRLAVAGAAAHVYLGGYLLQGAGGPLAPTVLPAPPG